MYFVTKSFPTNFTKCDGAPSPYETRIQELDPSGAVIQTSDPCVGPPATGNFTHVDIALNLGTGHPYLTVAALPQNPIQRVDIFGPAGPAPSLALEPVSAITATGGTISGTVNPNGPGTSYPDTTGTPSVTRTTYRVEYKKAAESSLDQIHPRHPDDQRHRSRAIQRRRRGPRGQYRIRTESGRGKAVHRHGRRSQELHDAAGGA